MPVPLRWIAVLAAVLVWTFVPAQAQREPVLKQIDVPHNYYYREMYLPQVTSGPSAAAWSPRGDELVISMQGSLWRHALGTRAARQIADGPGYDLQPDWSPDGRFIAYASYTGDAIELHLLDVQTGRTRALTANGAVNVEPRWSPDGRRIAFVSTLYNRRWHIHTLAVEDGVPGELLRLTEDHDSQLPRYYYSRWDHYLSPSWSPDGSEILFVSNRDRIWGTGGFWRMPAKPGAAARQIHYEETNWKARPDWSPDGKRVVYSSYLGRAWNQLWLMPADGGDVFPLTYGEFDATAPRWSHDGQRIAFISNDGGGTTLNVIDVPGGKRQKAELIDLQYLHPIGRLDISVMDAATGRATPARVSVTGPDGRSFAPIDAWRHADDAFERSKRKFEYGYFHTAGQSTVTVPAGRVEVEVARGLEYRVTTQAVDVRAGATKRVEIRLERLDDLPAKGWFSGDLHVHMNYGGTYRNDPARLRFQAEAEDLHVVESLIVNKEQRIPDASWFTGRLDPVSTQDTMIFHGQEFHTSIWGHMGLLGLRDHLVLPDYAGYVNTAAASLHPANATVADLARAQRGLSGYVHPFDTEPDPSSQNQSLTNELPIDAALGKVDYYEVVGFSDHLASARVWYRLLNCGFHIPAGAGTDAMANYASLRGHVGMNRVFVKSGTPLDHDRWLDALKAGRTFATNGPLLEFSIDGRGPGEDIALVRPGRLGAQVGLKSIVPLDHLEIVGNGNVVASVPLSGTRQDANATVPLDVAESGWYTLRAWSKAATHPVLDIYPFATTSPVYVTVGGSHVRSPEDARYFIAWIDRVAAAAQQHPGWNTPAERQGVLDLFARARRIYEKM